MEWVTLTKYTGNQTYADLALKAVSHIANLVSTIVLALYLCPHVRTTFKPNLHPPSSLHLFQVLFVVIKKHVGISVLIIISGLAAQGINPATGLSVGGYVVSGVLFPYHKKHG